MTEATALVGGVVHTVDASDTSAEAVLLKDGVIAKVGTSAEIRTAAGDASVIELAGRTVMPGFIDAHNHVSIAALAPVEVECATPPVDNLSTLLERLAAAAHGAVPGRWLTGSRFEASLVSEGRGPSLQELDEAAPDNPFFLIDSSCHKGWANSRALRAVGYDSHTPQPWGGEIVRNHAGNPTGELLESAINPVLSAAWDDIMLEGERGIDLLEETLDRYLGLGITGVTDALVLPAAADLYRRADAVGRLPLTVQQAHGADGFFARQDLRRTDIVDRIRESDTRMLRSGTMKIFTDRAFPGPAIDEHHHSCTTHTGSAFYSRSEVMELATMAGELGISPMMHALGNCAVDGVLEGYESLRRLSGDGLRLRIDHLFIAESRQAERAAALGADLVVNPGVGYEMAEVLGHWRSPGQGHLKLLPVASLIDVGARVTLASDHPCGIVSPAQIMWSAVTRRSLKGNIFDGDEAISPAQALRCYTANAAHTVGREAEEGTVEVGKRGNVIVTDIDPLVCDVEAIRDMNVVATYVDGQLKHGGVDAPAA